MTQATPNSLPPELEYRISLVEQRIAALQEAIVSSALASGEQAAITSYALSQMEYKGALLEARYILALLKNPAHTGDL